MTEHDGRHVQRTEDRFVVGPSELRIDGDTLTIRVDELTVPLPRRLRGEIRLHMPERYDVRWDLDGDGHHHWQPIAPAARIEVDFEHPGLYWKGSGYLDSNDGSEPLEAGFRDWHWSRTPHGDGALLAYDARRRDGSVLELALDYREGRIEPVERPPLRQLPTTLWRVARSARAEADVSVAHTAEDTPFYARSMLAHEIDGTPVRTMHESLDLDRFASRWVQTLLPFRMPRRR